MSDDEPIGQATMEEDGTIVLDLHPRGSDGTVGIARMRIPRGDPRYEETLEHLGGLKPGEQKLCPPFPDED